MIDVERLIATIMMACCVSGATIALVRAWDLMRVASSRPVKTTTTPGDAPPRAWIRKSRRRR